MAMSEKVVQEPSSERDGSSSVDSSDKDDGDAVELMVTARAKRVTAGNRLSSLLDKEGKDDIDLLFAENDEEEEEDVEFEEEDVDASDAELDSSSDEEDQSSVKDDDDLAGEKELQKQDRLERKKRKAQDIFNRPGAMRKRVKIDPIASPASGSPSAPAPRQKKKSERVSWVPTPADAPTRISSRKQTVKNREVVHKRLVDSEQQRMKIMKQMEAAQKRKDAQKVRPMTQVERLEEAAKTERKNAKSLNRWEEAEKKRSEEQKAKLEALHNRQLTGPVISLWSGIARWINGKVFQVGVREIRNAGFKEQSVLATKEKEESRAHQRQPNASHGTKQDIAMSESPQVHRQSQSPAHGSDQSSGPPKKPAAYNPPQGSSGLLDGIHAYAVMPTQMKQPEFTGTAHDGFQATPSTPVPHGHPTNLPPLPKPIVPIDEYSSRNLVALRNIDANASRVPELHDTVLLKKQKLKLQKLTPTFCAITSQPARFRDPKTGLPYANTYAYNEIQRLNDGGPRWSNLLDCYVGSTTIVARGVPERFFKKP